jgi:hypothetical protein
LDHSRAELVAEAEPLRVGAGGRCLCYGFAVSAAGPVALGLEPVNDAGAALVEVVDDARQLSRERAGVFDRSRVRLVADWSQRPACSRWRSSSRQTRRMRRTRLRRAAPRTTAAPAGRASAPPARRPLVHKTARIRAGVAEDSDDFRRPCRPPAAVPSSTPRDHVGASGPGRWPEAGVPSSMTGRDRVSARWNATPILFTGSLED